MNTHFYVNFVVLLSMCAPQWQCLPSDSRIVVTYFTPLLRVLSFCLRCVIVKQYIIKYSRDVTLTTRVLLEWSD